MKVSSSKEKILKKIREALSNPVPLPFPNSDGSKGIFVESATDLDLLFAEEFVRISGKFSFCLSDEDAANQLAHLFRQRGWKKIYVAEEPLISFIEPNLLSTDLANCDVSITTCHYLVARTGSVVLSSKQNGRTPAVYAPVHICIAYTDQLVYDTRDALKKMKDEFKISLPSSITFAAGPSRTGDIEKTLVVGVHGPKEVFVFLIERMDEVKQDIK